MTSHTRIHRSMTLAAALLLSTSATALAGDGKPFLMKVGTGQASTSIASDGNYHDAASVSITPKKSGLCAVSASATAALTAGDFLTVSLSTTSGAVGPWLQAHSSPTDTLFVSPAITQAFVVTKGIPVTFYLTAQSTPTSTNLEVTRIWVICESEKEPVLP